jgi:hypothetical protein
LAHRFRHCLVVAGFYQKAVMAIGDQIRNAPDSGSNRHQARGAGFEQAHGHVVNNICVQENIVLCESPPLGFGEHVARELDLPVNSKAPSLGAGSFKQAMVRAAHGHFGIWELF